MRGVVDLLYYYPSVWSGWRTNMLACVWLKGPLCTNEMERKSKNIEISLGPRRFSRVLRTSAQLYRLLLWAWRIDRFSQRGDDLWERRKALLLGKGVGELASLPNPVDYRDGRDIIIRTSEMLSNLPSLSARVWYSTNPYITVRLYFHLSQLSNGTERTPL